MEDKGLTEHKLAVEVSISRQRLQLFAGRQELDTYQVSTALKGTGQRFGSECTPLGRHRVRLKIGYDCPLNTVFVGRRPTGELFNERLAASSPSRDWILTRIIWLTGLQTGYNRGGTCDTLRRFIYIHGTPDMEPMGVPGSHGCIRMRNHELVTLFNQVSVGTPVLIRP